MPRRDFESWLCLMHEVGLLRVPPPVVFGRADADVTLSEGGAVVTRGAGEDSWRAAASTAVMRSEHHFAQFTVLSSGGNLYWAHPMLGVIRPGYAVEGGCTAFSMTSHCFCGTVQTVGNAALAVTSPATPSTGRGGRAQGRATASACCSTSTRAA